MVETATTGIDAKRGLKTLGIVGGVASGKSYVANAFKELGAAVLNADRAGHEVLKRPDVEQAARDRWGNDIFDATGRIDRPALAKIVFDSSPLGRQELNYLEQLTHPTIGALLGEQIAEAADRGIRVLILDAPVLLKAGWNRFCDKIVYVDAPREQRMARALGRGWSETDFSLREAAQETLKVKRELADFVIDNSGPPGATLAQIARIWHSLVD